MAVERHSSRFEIIGKLVHGNQLQLSRKQNFPYSPGVQKDDWLNVFTIEDFSDHKDILSQQLFLVTSKLKELNKCIEKINQKLNCPNGCILTSKSFKVALNLLNIHLTILDSAVKGLAQVES